MTAEWKTIDSAPKDGTRILLFRDGDHADGHWMSNHKVWGNDRRGWSYPEHVAPTHWMPLPPPPNQEGKEK